jgi:5-methylthioribose kinase
MFITLWRISGPKNISNSKSRHELRRSLKNLTDSIASIFEPESRFSHAWRHTLYIKCMGGFMESKHLYKYTYI